MDSLPFPSSTSSITARHFRSTMSSRSSKDSRTQHRGPMERGARMLFVFDASHQQFLPPSVPSAASDSDLASRSFDSIQTPSQNTTHPSSPAEYHPDTTVDSNPKTSLNATHSSSPSDLDPSAAADSDSKNLFPTPSEALLCAVHTLYGVAAGRLPRLSDDVPEPQAIICDLSKQDFKVLYRLLLDEELGTGGWHSGDCEDGKGGDQDDDSGLPQYDKGLWRAIRTSSFNTSNLSIPRRRRAIALIQQRVAWTYYPENQELSLRMSETVVHRDFASSLTALVADCFTQTLREDDRQFVKSEHKPICKLEEADSDDDYEEEAEGADEGEGEGDGEEGEGEGDSEEGEGEGDSEEGDGDKAEGACEHKYTPKRYPDGGILFTKDCKERGRCPPGMVIEVGWTNPLTPQRAKAYILRGRCHIRSVLQVDMRAVAPRFRKSTEPEDIPITLNLYRWQADWANNEFDVRHIIKNHDPRQTPEDALELLQSDFHESLPSAVSVRVLYNDIIRAFEEAYQNQRDFDKKVLSPPPNCQGLRRKKRKRDEDVGCEGSKRRRKGSKRRRSKRIKRQNREG